MCIMKKLAYLYKKSSRAWACYSGRTTYFRPCSFPSIQAMSGSNPLPVHPVMSDVSPEVDDMLKVQSYIHRLIQTPQNQALSGFLSSAEDSPSDLDELPGTKNSAAPGWLPFFCMDKPQLSFWWHCVCGQVANNDDVARTI